MDRDLDREFKQWQEATESIAAGETAAPGSWPERVRQAVAARGSGESEGEFREATLQSEISDARQAVRFMRSRKGVDPGRVGLCGLSLGGCVAATVAPAAKAQALVLWSAVAHPAILQQLSALKARQPAAGPAFVEYDARQVSLRLLQSAAQVDPLKAVGRFRKPTLIIHPGNDETVPRSHAQDFLAASAARVKEKVIIPGADHTFTGLAWEAEVIERTTDWFCAYL